ncbi:hypothetical protein [Pseudomonas segetis]|uniref:Uncharacterized protein n=1 Tax=Pseudomonas segetis TaxID=298908 RepID=A0A239C713_9PSED|nr:hypothetical protein [Pseudomonas segetis]SNS16016.1 hypothetical protein SAMN05216255_1547 [Pseudomonas segetis]
MCGSKLKKLASVATLGITDAFTGALEPPKAPDAPASVDPTPTEADPGVIAAREDEKRRRAAAAGQSSTILTGANGLTTQANTGQKTLLGA